jgi:hypothetical protein
MILEALTANTQPSVWPRLSGTIFDSQEPQEYFCVLLPPRPIRQLTGGTTSRVIYRQLLEPRRSSGTARQDLGRRFSGEKNGGLTASAISFRALPSA